MSPFSSTIDTATNYYYYKTNCFFYIKQNEYISENTATQRVKKWKQTVEKFDIKTWGR